MESNEAIAPGVGLEVVEEVGDVEVMSQKSVNRRGANNALRMVEVAIVNDMDYFSIQEI